MAEILIVEDEAAIADTLAFTLRAEGHSTTWHARANAALAHLRDHPVDLVILDVGLPDTTGFEACKQLRRFSDVPVIFLSARAGEVDRVVGLEIGADDYVVKPFSPREVAARVRVVLRRRQLPATPTGAAPPPDHAHGPLRLDDGRRVAMFRGQALALTPHEYHILACLLSRPGQVFSREQLLDAAGAARDAGYERTIDGHVRDLRAKLRAIDPGATPIRTHRGFGYSCEP